MRLPELYRTAACPENPPNRMNPHESTILRPALRYAQKFFLAFDLSSRSPLHERLTDRFQCLATAAAQRHS